MILASKMAKSLETAASVCEDLAGIKQRCLEWHCGPRRATAACGAAGDGLGLGEERGDVLLLMREP